MKFRSEGAVFITNRASTADGAVAIHLNGLVQNFSVLVAKVTDANGNTSNFSAPFTVIW